MAGYTGDGGPATSASLNAPRVPVVDLTGNIIFADTDNNRIRRVAAATGVITTLAGTGVGGFTGDGGPATSAGLAIPHGLTLDGSGHVIIADTGNHRIRRVAVDSGIITTLAGNGVPGFGGDGGYATSASLHTPVEVAVDDSGSVLIADHRNHRIRHVAATTGTITTLAGSGVGGFDGDGGPATSASLNFPAGLVVDGSGNLLIADHANHRVRRVAVATGVITTLAGTGVAGFGGDGGPATSARLYSPLMLSLDSHGNVLIVDNSNHRIRRVAVETGVITTLAGTGANGFCGEGGPASSAELHFPCGLAVDVNGNVLIADRGNHRIRRVSAPSLPTPSPTPTPSTTPYCQPALFRALPRTDLVGSLVGTALSPGEPVAQPTEASCRQACCDAAACDGYSFEAGTARFLGQASCYLYVNITQLTPVSGYVSGVRESLLL